MERIKPIVKPTGFSYIEVLFSFVLIINLFVLLTQIFYNINIKDEIDDRKKILVYELACLRIEEQIKDSDSIMVTPLKLTFTVQNNHFEYYVFENRFTLRINYTRMIYLIYDVKNVEFKLNLNMLTIIFTDSNDENFESRIILR